MKEWLCTIAGIVGGFIATLFGGWDSALATLVVFMGIDFATGLVTAVMGKSKHSKSGALNSKAGWIGLAKKFCILLMVVVGVRIDILIPLTLPMPQKQAYTSALPVLKLSIFLFRK